MRTGRARGARPAGTGARAVPRAAAARPRGLHVARAADGEDGGALRRGGPRSGAGDAETAAATGGGGRVPTQDPAAGSTAAQDFPGLPAVAGSVVGARDPQSLGAGGPPTTVTTATAAPAAAAHAAGADEAGADEAGLAAAQAAWAGFLEHAAAVEAAEAECEALGAEVQRAAAEEDYARAARLRDRLQATRARDALARARDALHAAVEAEDFARAAELRDGAEARLEGWWAGRGAQGDPNGHLLHVRAQYGRYVGTAVTARDLAAQQLGLGAELELGLAPPPAFGPGLQPDLERGSGLAGARDGGDGRRAAAGGEGEAGAPPSRSLEEVAFDELLEGWELGPVPVMELFLREEEGVLRSQPCTLHPASVVLPGDEALAAAPVVAQIGPDADVRLVPENVLSAAELGGLEDGELLLDREPAQIAWEAPDRFTLTTASGEFRDRNLAAELAEHLAVPLEGAAPAGAAPAEAGEEEAGSMRSTIAELVKASQETYPQLSGVTQYQRLAEDATALDPFTGYYIGNFGKHGPELLRLSRSVALAEDGSREEWVQATKVTGDKNVPAGTVSFRARIGRQHRLDTKMYPDDLMIKHRFAGEGRVAKADYQEPKWVDGDLLVFQKQANPLMMGAEMGFVWSVPGRRRYLILLNRVDLALS